VRLAFLIFPLLITACGGQEGEPRAVKAVSGDGGAGSALFNQVCSTCHEADGGGKRAVGAPAIANLAPWYVKRQLTHFRDGVRGGHAEDVEGQMMAEQARNLSDEQIFAVASFIDTLPAAEPAITVAGDAQRGADHYANVCSACHGSDGLGNETLGAPALVGLDDWYLERQYGKFREGIRGSHPDDKFGVQMVRIAPVLENDDTLRDVIAWLASRSSQG
jgi:cytochrome c553